MSPAQRAVKLRAIKRNSKWADLSEDAYGISILNDCKYGLDIKDGVIRLTLLRSPVWPDFDSDREIHEFSYAILPHAGGWREAETARRAYEFNVPPVIRIEPPHAGSLRSDTSFLSIDVGHAMIETVKKAEDSDAMIARIVEFEGRSCPNAHFHSYKTVKSVHECDMMENDGNEMILDESGFAFQLAPYEIKTFKIEFREEN
jgi:alpha-mannosidase